MQANPANEGRLGLAVGRLSARSKYSICSATPPGQLDYANRASSYLGSQLASKATKEVARVHIERKYDPPKKGVAAAGNPPPGWLVLGRLSFERRGEAQFR